MSRDFAKNNYNRKTASYGRNTKNSKANTQQQPWLWLLAGMVFGLIIAAVFYVKEHSIKINPLKRESLSAHHEMSRSHKKFHLVNKTEPQPQFDFYSMLPKMQDEVADTANTITNANGHLNSQPNKPQLIHPQINTPESDQLAKSAAATLTAPIKHPTNVTSNYILQVAAFRHFKDADKLKAELTLLGFNANIKPIVVNNQPWNRVLVGPFKNQKAVIFAKQQLAENHLKGIIVKG